jgi:hypothetical protein
MLDYKLHYAVLLAEDRLRNRQTRSESRGTKRIFRLGNGHTTARDGQR